MPSSLVSDSGNGLNGDGGYQGQYSLDAGRPMIAEVKVWGHIGNPVAYEDQWVKSFAKANGGIAPEPENKTSAAAASALRRSFKRDTRSENTTVYNEMWYPAVDSIAGLYINYLYSPKKSLNYDCSMRVRLVIIRVRFLARRVWSKSIRRLMLLSLSDSVRV